jgi:acyl phosphate:glycerol-3-phosphate acyltransferase
MSGAPLAAALIAGAYLLGSIPFGFVMARAVAGVDIREAGSGNIGATNVARVVGKPLGVLVLVLDAAKGFGPTFLAQRMAPDMPWVHVAVAGAAIAGHMFPVYLRFRGGKGVATGLGVVLALSPIAAAAGAVTYGALFAAFRVSSIGSLSAAAVVAGTLFVTRGLGPYGWFGAAVFVAIVARHRGNIARLLHHEEKPL